MEEKYLITKEQLEQAGYAFTYVLKLKNYLRYAIFIIIGTLLIIFMKNIAGLILGIIFIGFPLANIFLIKDRPIVEINDEIIVVRDVFSTAIYLFKWEDVLSYGVERNNRGVESTNIVLEGNVPIMIPSAAASLQDQFRKRIPEKEQLTLWKQQMEARKKKREGK